MPSWTTGLDRDSIEEQVYADTLANMHLDSSAEMDLDEITKVEAYIDMLVEAQSGEWANGPIFGEDRDISWDGPLAEYLDMVGIRPIMEGVDVGMTAGDE